MSSGASTASDTELVETMATINLMELKEFAFTKKPKKKKKSSKKRNAALKCQNEPETNVMEEEKYHLKNSLYTACKVGDKESLKSLLSILYTPQVTADLPVEVGQGQILESQSEGSEELFAGSKPEQPVIAEGYDKVVGNVPEDKKQIIQEETVNQRTGSDINIIQENRTFSTNDLTTEGIEQDDLTSSTCDRKTDQNSIQDKEYTQNESCRNSDFPTKDETLDMTLNEKVVDESTKADHIVNISETSNISTAEKDDNVNSSDNSKTHTDLNTQKASLKLVTTKNVTNEMGTWPDFSPVVTPGLLSEQFGDNNTTLLHVAAKEGQVAIVKILMEFGANPAVRDKGGLTPYMVSKDKATRNEFRKFMGIWPDKYDYEKAQIPGPLTEEMEIERKRKEAERKKAQKKVKQEQQKLKKEVEEKQKAEEREKQRYLNLSDREKRALAAERRLVSQVTNQGEAQPVLCRCFQCGADMTGKVPFEYCDNKFCTSKCLQQHRKSQKKS